MRHSNGYARVRTDFFGRQRFLCICRERRSSVVHAGVGHLNDGRAELSREHCLHLRVGCLLLGDLLLTLIRREREELLQVCLQIGPIAQLSGPSGRLRSQGGRDLCVAAGLSAKA